MSGDDFAPASKIRPGRGSGAQGDRRPRCGHTALLCGKRMVIVGGHDGQQFLSDVWECELESMYWQRPECRPWCEKVGDEFVSCKPHSFNSPSLIHSFICSFIN